MSVSPLSSATHSPANLPALIPAQPDPAADHPSETALFTRTRQAAFLAALAHSGSVRSAAASARVSHQTAYRARLGSPGFRCGWDAALLAARARSEEVLACKAVDGWEEDVIYHGEVVCTRRRFSDRLLLAHLGRLDRLCGDAEVAAFAEDFDAVLARFEAGEDLPTAPCVAPCPSTGSGRSGVLGEDGEDNFSASGEWSMRSTLRQAQPLRQAQDGRELGEAEDVPPPLPPKREHGSLLKEAQQLEIGDYEVWFDEALEQTLTTWPAPPDFSGEELAVLTDYGDVIARWPLDPAVHGEKRCYWARTLTPDEEAGLVAADERAADHRAARLALYQRAAFGLATPAERASLSAANGGDEQWGSVRAAARG